MKCFFYFFFFYGRSVFFFLVIIVASLAPHCPLLEMYVNYNPNIQLVSVTMCKILEFKIK